MARETKAAAAERQQAIDQLREWMKPGDTVYTILDHVSSSGMSRAIRVLVPLIDRHDDEHQPATVDFRHPNWAVGKALGLRHWKRNGREQDALVVGGCGMDMGFHLVYELSQRLYGRRQCSGCKRVIPYDYPTDVTCGECDGEIVGGYKCLGKGKCPSNYHSNHRDHLTCEGTMVYNPDGPNTGVRCWRPSLYRTDAIPDSWPRSAPIELGEGQTIPGHPLACIATPDEETGIGEYIVCPTCQGAGSVPNPAGPERFDLVHTDGYALKQRWL